jgi:membrane protease YdiL (CAAX protease family)
MMFPEGIGLMCYNGARGLLYYASQAGRLLASNGGIVTTIVLGSSSFPGQAAVSLGGAVASRAGTWLTREIDARYQVHLANAHDWLLNQLPASVGTGYFRLTQALAAPQRAISGAVAAQALPPQLFWINDYYVRELIAPVVEEVMFRAGIQGGLGLALARFGVPAGAADSIATLIAATLFAGAHNPDPREQQFRQTLIAGIAYGVMMYVYGLPAAVMTHAFYNFSIRMEQCLARQIRG